MKEENWLTSYMLSYGLMDLKRTFWCLWATLLFCFGVQLLVHLIKGWQSFEVLVFDSLTMFVVTVIAATAIGVTLCIIYYKKTNKD